MDIEGAIDDFNNSLKINPDNELIFYLGNVKLEYGDFKGAILDYEKLTLIEDFKDEIFYNIAYAQAQNLNYEEAINNYSKSIKYDQNDDYTYLNRGNAKFKRRY